MIKNSHKKVLHLNPLQTRSRVFIKEQSQLLPSHKKNPFNPDLSSKTHLSLFLKYSETDLNFHIPPTLVLLKHLNQETLYYHKAGELHMETGTSIISKFFDLTKDQEVQKYRTPKFITFTSSGISLISEEDDLKQVLRSESQIIVQKFVSSDKKNSSKLRVFWTRDKGFSYLNVVNKNSLPKTLWFQEETLKKVQSSYLFRVNDFHYAGRLLKTSMSPFNLYSSKLKQSCNTKAKLKTGTFDNRRNSHAKTNYIQSFYLTKQSNPETSSSNKLLLTYPKLEFVVLSIMNSFDKWTENLGFQAIKKACFDFLEDRKGKWFLIGCKFKDIDLDAYLACLRVKKVTVNGESQVQEVRFEDFSGEIQKFSEKIINMKTRLESLSLTSAAYVDTDRSAMISVYKPVTSGTSEWASIKKESDLSPIAKLYDSTINKARELKKKTKQFSEIFKDYSSKGSKILEIIDEIVEVLTLNDNFAPFMRHYLKVMNFRDFLDNCLRGVVFSLKSGTNQLLKDLGVTRRNFQDFIMILNSTLSKHYEEDLKEIILETIIESSGFT